MSIAALGRLSRSASSIVAKPVNGFHLLRIDGYSQTKTLLPGEKLASQSFTVGGHSWHIDYYPNGRDASAKSNAISVYLQLSDHTTRLQAQYKFSLLDQGGNAAYELPAKTGSFNGVPRVDFPPTLRPYSHLDTMGTFRSPAAVEEQGPGCGHEEFIGREELERRREDLIRDDRLVVRCDVGVAQIDRSLLAGDELSEEEEEEEDEQYRETGYGYAGYAGYGPPPRRRRQIRTDDGEYVKWCLTQEPRGSRDQRRHEHEGMAITIIGNELQ